MPKKSLQDRIRLFLLKGWKADPDKWCNGGTIEKLAMEARYKGSTASRICRSMAEAGVIDREEKVNPQTKVNSVWYKYKPRREDIISREFQR